MLVGIAVDCSVTGGNPGHTECRWINLETGEIVFDEQIGIATNNIGEFFGIAYGAEYIKSNNLNLPLWSDSKIGISWYHKKMCKTNIFRDYPTLAQKNPRLATLIEESIEIVRENNVEIKLWDKKVMGKENPADYNRK